VSEDSYHVKHGAAPTQQTHALALMQAKGLVRLAEFAQAGITASTISRMERGGLVVRLARGLYQLPDATVDTHHTLAEAAKLVPRGVVCLTSALAFHGLTDQIAAKVWIAIGPKDWRPTFQYPPVRFVRFAGIHMSAGVEHHAIDGVDVPIFGVTKTVVDLFRYRGTVGINIAIEGLREALRTKKTKPGRIAKCAADARIWKVIEPYLMALTSHV
jgi:predicted transcriptional regulator of viral defense system